MAVKQLLLFNVQNSSVIFIFVQLSDHFQGNIRCILNYDQQSFDASSVLMVDILYEYVSVERQPCSVNYCYKLGKSSATFHIV